MNKSRLLTDKMYLCALFYLNNNNLQEPYFGWLHSKLPVCCAKKFDYEH